MDTSSAVTISVAASASGRPVLSLSFDSRGGRAHRLLTFPNASAVADVLLVNVSLKSLHTSADPNNSCMLASIP